MICREGTRLLPTVARAFPERKEEKEMSQKVYTEDVLRLARENENFRRVLFTTERSQLVLMSLRPGEEIGEEVHEGIDQVLAFADGQGEAVIEGSRSPVRAGSVVVVPGGTRHNFVNTGDAPLKLVTVYTPPEHPDGTIHHTKEDADKYEREQHHRQILKRKRAPSLRGSLSARIPIKGTRHSLYLKCSGASVRRQTFRGS
jgi:mannose-6-phosphate isomerase-like protein (cupin superfamily)